MPELELSTPDRARLDTLIAELERYNSKFDCDVIISCTEAARILHLARTTITQMLKDGRLHRKTIGLSSGILLSEIRNIQNSL